MCSASSGVLSADMMHNAVCAGSLCFATIDIIGHGSCFAEHTVVSVSMGIITPSCYCMQQCMLPAGKMQMTVSLTGKGVICYVDGTRKSSDSKRQHTSVS